MKLLHLYYDIMNLYGEYANVTILKRHLEDQGLSVELHKKTLQDQFDCSQYDFIYLGAGTETSQKTVLSHLLPHRQELLAAAENGAVILFTGNACELLGRTITDLEGREYEALNLADFTTEETNQRITGDAICQWGQEEDPLVGFINKCAWINGSFTPLFTLSMGPGNQSGSKEEGVSFQNVFGTHLTGPILVKNPAFLNALVSLLGERENPDFILQPKDYPYEQQAYQVTLSELIKRRDGA